MSAYAPKRTLAINRFFIKSSNYGGQMIRINKVHKIWRQSRDVLAGLAFIATGLGR